MLEQTYADKAFSDNIRSIAENTNRTATALEAIANHLGVIVGMMKMDRHAADRPVSAFTPPQESAFTLPQEFDSHY